MALQTSGAISVSDLATEFGGTAPHSLNEYYRGGGLVPDTAANAGIPTSGQIQLDDFYGGSVVSGPSEGELWALGGQNAVYQAGKGILQYILGTLGVATDPGGAGIVSSPAQTAAGGSNWVQTDTGCSFNYGIMCRKSDGRLWAWGQNISGCLGIGSTTSFVTSPLENWVGATNWGFGVGNQITSLFTKTDGRLWVWGQQGNNPNSGVLGTNESTVINRSSPQQTVAGGTDWVYDEPYACKMSSALDLVNGGVGYAAALKTDGRLWLWGINNSGQLGDNTVTNRSSPQQTVAGGTDWANIAINYNNWCSAVKTDGRLWGWGANAQGNLADGTIVNRSSPVQNLTGATDWASVISASQAVKTDGRLWVWGNNSAGRLAVPGGGNANRSSPIQTVAGGTDWASDRLGGDGDSSSANYQAIVKTDGRLWTWGVAQHQNYTTAITTSSPVNSHSGTTWQWARGSGISAWASKT